jgi:hypothetical protein
MRAFRQATAVLTLVVLFLFGRPVAAQYLADLPASFEKLQLRIEQPRRLQGTQSLARVPDHRYEGAIIGGLVFGIGGAC